MYIQYTYIHTYVHAYIYTYMRICIYRYIYMDSSCYRQDKETLQIPINLLKFADECRRMLTYADVCGRYADGMLTVCRR